MSGVHFVLPMHASALLAEIEEMRADATFPFWSSGDVIWSALSFVVLREHRDGLTLGTTPMPDRLNFAHVGVWRALGARTGEFRVSARADYRRLFDVDLEVLQNPVQAAREGRPYFPHWPVPGLLPRDPGRRGALRIAYAGRRGTGTMAAEVERAVEAAAGSAEFVIVPPEAWNDMREIDVLVAIRSLDTSTHDNKPPSKLFNAWRAGIPLIAGWDSAYSAIATPGREYLRVRSGGELSEALRLLTDDEAEYRRLVSFGTARAPEVSFEAIASEWLRQIDGPLASAFERWRERGGPGIASRIGRMADGMRALASRSRRHLDALGGRR